jgi:hypothetical protein
MHNVIDVTIDFEFGLLNNKSMKVVVAYEKDIFEATPDNPSVKITQVNLPNSFEIQFSGKTNKDTIVDENGNILQDMYVKVVGLKFDHLIVPNWIVQKKLSYLTTSGQTLKTAYIGFNGLMKFDIPETNIFSLFRRLNKDE